MRAALVVVIILIAACGSKSPDPEPAPTLKQIGRFPGATLVASSGGRVALAMPERWYEVIAGGTREVPTIGAELAKLRAQHGDLELFLGVDPVVVAGEEHHEEVTRLVPEPRPIAFEGHIVRVVASRDAEVWQFEERLRARLALVDVRGETLLPAHENIGAPIVSPSPVSAKRCAAPAILDLYAQGDEIHALLVECNPAAPVRVVTYGRGATGFAIRNQLAIQPTELVLKPSQLAGTVVVGIADGKLAISRRSGTTRSTIAASLVLEAVLASDGSVWTLTTTERDERALARDGIVVSLAARPSQLGLDDDAGVVVLADGILFAR